LAIAALGVLGGLIWLGTALERRSRRDVARAALWPRWDERVRSYGEVWSHPGDQSSDAVSEPAAATPA
jgi:hypothetical protein